MNAPKAMLPGSTSADGRGRPVTLGVPGGGQLGRMFVHAAQTLGFATVVLDPDPGSPAGAASNHHVHAAYLDGPGLAEMVARCDALTTEFENVPAQALALLSAQRPVSPSAAAVSVCQHRAREKAHFVRAGVPCVPFTVVEREADLACVDPTLFPGILKSATLGYDGKGQILVDDAGALHEAWRTLREVPCVLEQRVRLCCELSVIVARSATGQFVHLPVQQNLHRDGILAVTQVPAPDVPARTAALAADHARAIAESLEYVGVLCVEFFVLADGSLLANEMAPRPHNSGHYSIDACDLSQFDLQVRTTAGLSLVAPRLHSAAVMLNLLGDLWFPAGAGGAQAVPPWDAVLALPGVHLHLYGKSDARPGRKMGHVTVTAANLPAAQAVAREVAGLLGIAPF